MKMRSELSFGIRVLDRAAMDAWICGDDAEAERLRGLADLTRKEEVARLNMVKS